MGIVENINDLMKKPPKKPENISHKAHMFQIMLEGSTTTSIKVRCLTNAGIIEATWYAGNGESGLLNLFDAAITLQSGEKVTWPSLFLDADEIVALNIQSADNEEEI